MVSRRQLPRRGGKSSYAGDVKKDAPAASTEDVLSDVERDIAKVFASLRLLAAQSAAVGAPSVAPHPAVPLQPWELAALTVKRRRERNRILGDIFTDPGWDILLVLFVNGATGRITSIADLNRAMTATPTTTLRWIDVMADEGHIQKSADPGDGRRVILSLTTAAERKMHEMLTSWLQPIDPETLRAFANARQGGPGKRDPGLEALFG